MILESPAFDPATGCYLPGEFGNRKGTAAGGLIRWDIHSWKMFPNSRPLPTGVFFLPSRPMSNSKHRSVYIAQHWFRPDDLYFTGREGNGWEFRIFADPAPDHLVHLLRSPAALWDAMCDLYPDCWELLEG